MEQWSDGVLECWVSGVRCQNGLRVASCEFNNACEEMFQGVPLIRYSDDCTQKASSENELLDYLEKFLSRCVERNVPLKLKKCVFGAEEMEFLSYKVFDFNLRVRLILFLVHLF